MDNNILMRAKAAKSADELISIAKEHGAELSADTAERLMENIKNGEISDEVLENAVGGCGGEVEPPKWCTTCGVKMKVRKIVYFPQTNELDRVIYMCPTCLAERTYRPNELKNGGRGKIC